MLTDKQKEVVFHGKGNILVSASAGSGKTHTMIERIIRLVSEEKVNVNEILCVTFTEAAAFEMKEKLKNALHAKIANGNESDKHLKNQLSEIPTADICTLHAFCARLIRLYFFEADVAPDFKIADESDSAVIKERSIEKTFRKLYESGEEWFYKFLDRHAVYRSDNALKELVLKAYEFASSEAYPEEFMQKSLSVYTEQGFNHLYDIFKAYYDKEISSLIEKVETNHKIFVNEDLKKGSEFTKNLLGDMKNMLKAKDLFSLKGYEDYKLDLNFERNISEDIKERKEEVKGIRDQVKAINKKYLSKVGKDRQSDFALFNDCKVHTEYFIKILQIFTGVYLEEKAEDGLLDFNDLEHFALKVLSNESIKSAVRDKYKYIFVDEYQDTSGVQESIINLIENDNVFMVGDVKQSIYGFRGCRSEFFSLKDSLMTAQGQKVVRLNANFRSAKNVLETVNSIFNYAMTEEYYGENYRGRSELVYGETYDKDALGRTQLHYMRIDDLTEEEKENKKEIPRIYDVVQENPSEQVNNTTDFSALIAKIILEETGKTYYDTKKKEYRRISFGDIAILTRSEKSAYAHDLISGLVRKGIPVNSDAEVNVLDFPEIMMMLNALKLVDCFSQDVPLASTLKSPIGRLTDEELMDVSTFYRESGNRGTFVNAYKYYIENATTPLKDKLLAFDEYINKIRLLSDFIGAQGVLEKLITDNNISGYLYATVGGEEKVDRLNRFVSASVSSTKVLTVKEFIRKTETCPKAFGISHFASENTVKAMTIHASKGLEFPVVIICGLERGFNTTDDYKEIIFDREYGFAVKTYDDLKRTKEENVLRSVIRKKMAEERMREEMRLFYVATTRATYSLHLAYMSKKELRKERFDGMTKYIDCIPLSMPVIEYGKDQLELLGESVGVRKILVGDVDPVKTAKMHKKFQHVYPFLVETSLPLKYTVTAVNSEESKDFYATHVLYDDEYSTGAERGVIAHKFLELYDFYSNEDCFAQAKKMVNDGLINQDDLDKIDLSRIENALKGGAFNDIKNYVIYREKSFLVGIEGEKVSGINTKEKVLLQGVIDMLAVCDNKAQIIDYKYSSLDGESLKNKYKKQLELYAYATEVVLGLKVERKAIVNLFTGQTVIL